MANKWIGALSLLLCGQLMASELVIESWRIDDKALWEEKIIPAFEAAHPGIQVSFNWAQDAEYMPALWGRRFASTACCRPPSTSLWPRAALLRWGSVSRCSWTSATPAAPR